jgi:hypothetical protein
VSTVPTASMAAFAVKLKLEAESGMRMMVVIQSNETALAIQRDLSDEVLAITGQDCVVLRDPVGPRVVERLVSETKATVPVMVLGFGAFAVADWIQLDELRSRFERSGPLLFVVTKQEADALVRHAPNFASWFSGAVHLVANEHELSVAERNERVKELERRTGKTSEEVVAAAGRDELPRDPEYAEWLVLLGRSDLIGR